MHPRPRHVTQLLEPYLDEQLSPEERRQVTEHLAECPLCAQRFFDAQRVKSELGPVLKTVLGQPTPPLALRPRVREALDAIATSRPFVVPWIAAGRAFNAVATLAIIVLLALGVLTIIRGQLSGIDVTSEIQPVRPSEGGGEIAVATNTLTFTPSPLSQTTVVPTSSERSSLGDTLPRPRPIPADLGEASKTPLPLPSGSKTLEGERLFNQERDQLPGFPQIDGPKLPGGTIAFSIFNPATDRQFYETHLINPDGTHHRLFLLNGVSEPALSPDGQYIAYRAWSDPTSPRSLLSSNLEGLPPHRVGGFWEDAQPDWSPTEYRLVFASQREVDRRWRLYTSWGDGTNEVNLRREGKSPTFAPDGYRFAFESCDDTGNKCGLWLGDLDNSEYDAYPILEDPLAKSPDWSPVGEQIVYMANPDGNWDLYLVNSDGSNVRRLTTNRAVDGLPVWSPDGKWLAFLSNRDGAWGIWLLHVESGQRDQVVSLPGATFTPPERSPYGQRNWSDEQLSWSRRLSDSSDDY